MAHIIASLGIGGAERHLVNLLNAMSCEYRAVICLVPDRPGRSFRAELDPDIEQFLVRVRLRSLPIGILKLASLLKRINVDVVHTHMYGSNLYGAVAAKLAGVPVVITSEHGENPWKKRHQRWLERNVISPLVDMRFCVSPRILELRRDCDGVPASKLMLVANGTILPDANIERSENQTVTIGAVGRFIPAKDYPVLLQAVAELRSRGYELKLYIVGYGPEFDTIAAMVNELGLQSTVTLPGLASDMDSWYRCFDIYVSSSAREGLPLALLEAMAYQLPVVATDVGAAATTVNHDVGGLIVPSGDPLRLADALGQLLDDKSLRDRLGKGARMRIEQEFSVSSVAEFHENIYQELVARKVEKLQRKIPDNL